MQSGKALKILLTVHQFFPEYFSGTEVLTFSVAKELKRRGYEVFVFTGFPAKTHLPDEERFDEYELEGIRVFRFHHAYVPMGGQSAVTEVEYDNHLVARHFTRLLQDIAPDLIHFFHMSRLGGGLIDVAVHAGIPSYFTPTDFWTICPTSQLLLRDGKVCAGPSRFGGNCVQHVAELTRGLAVKRVSALVPTALVDVVTGLTARGLLPRYPMNGEVAAMSRRKPFLVERLNWLQAVVSPTKLMTEVLTRNGVDPGLIVESAYGIDIAGPETTALHRDGNQPVTFGFIGTLASHKGCHVLLEAFTRLDPQKARLKIYGNPSDFPDYFAQLKTQAQGAANIEFCGTFPNSEVAAVLKGIDVLIVPSLWYENTPLVVYSALAAKRPLIVSDFPGLTETVKDGWNGLSFPPGDAAALRQRLSRLVDEAGLIDELSANCKRPKSSVEYVDELTALYAKSSVPRPNAKARTFAPLEDLRGAGFITGWAVADHDAPRTLGVYLNDQLIGETARFLPRPDVRDGLKRSGVGVRSAAVGFAVRIKTPFDRTQVTVRFDGASGPSKSFDLSGVAVGASIRVDDGSFIGIDSERQPVNPA